MIGQAVDPAQVWSGSFGREYTDRNEFSPATLDYFYQQTYGITRRQLNLEFLQDIPRHSRILEVGCNVGTQLLMLRELGFSSLSGSDIQSYALKQVTNRAPGVKIVRASALALPYPDKYFDLVFTSGVLIHIAPRDLPAALGEINRCARTWIWGFEYFATDLTEINYRGRGNLLWKADYARMYAERFPDLHIVKQQMVHYFENSNVDSMFLLQRSGAVSEEAHACGPSQ